MEPPKKSERTETLTASRVVRLGHANVPADSALKLFPVDKDPSIYSKSQSANEFGDVEIIEIC